MKNTEERHAASALFPVLRQAQDEEQSSRIESKEKMACEEALILNLSRDREQSSRIESKEKTACEEALILNLSKDGGRAAGRYPAEVEGAE